jgi:hypothetical protein
MNALRGDRSGGDDVPSIPVAHCYDASQTPVGVALDLGATSQKIKRWNVPDVGHHTVLFIMLDELTDALVLIDELCSIDRAMLADGQNRIAGLG